MHNELEFRLRRFRVAFVAILAWPWVVRIVVTAVNGDGFSAWFVSSFGIAVALAVAGWRKPAGVAPVLVLCSLGLTFLLSLSTPRIPLWWGIVCLVEAAILVALLAPTWREVRAEHRHSELRGIDRRYARGDSRASTRRTERELRRAGRKSE